MKILILCTYFPPDTAIGAVRPFMFAKYLSLLGHEVTVLRSGEFDCIPENYYGDYNGLFRVVSYLGENSQAERFNRGQLIDKKEIQDARKLSWLPDKTRDKVKTILKPVSGIPRINKARRNYPYLIKAIDELKRTESFDCVFSTYGNLENVWGGLYAAKAFQTKFIMDFRDLIVWYHDRKEIVWNIYSKFVQRRILKEADAITTVSEGLSGKLRSIYSDAIIHTIYNGYEREPEEPSEKAQTQVKCLTICYLGKLYQERLRALGILAEALSSLFEDNTLEKSKVQFVYAGKDERLVKELFRQYGIESVLKCLGYVDRSTANQIQSESDIFLVLSWNSKESQGILTGKFYEAICAEKPILAIVAGKEPNSELRVLNEKYQYGFCYEESMSSDDYGLFLDYLKSCYGEKIEKGCISYTQDPELATKFRYDCLTKELEDIMYSLTGREGKGK